MQLSNEMALAKNLHELCFFPFQKKKLVQPNFNDDYQYLRFTVTYIPFGFHSSNIDYADLSQNGFSKKIA